MDSQLSGFSRRDSKQPLFGIIPTLAYRSINKSWIVLSIHQRRNGLFFPGDYSGRTVLGGRIEKANASILRYDGGHLAIELR